MKSFLPKHLQDLFKKNQDEHAESRIFAEDVRLYATIREIADQTGMSEEEAAVQLAKAQQHQQHRHEENLSL